MQESTESRPLMRVMALHALAYCERLFYLEEVEEIRVADHRVYVGHPARGPRPGGRMEQRHPGERAEEERLLGAEEDGSTAPAKPQRLFPADDERLILHVTEPGTRLGKRGEQILVTPREGAESAYPSHNVAALVLPPGPGPDGTVPHHRVGHAPGRLGEPPSVEPRAFFHHPATGLAVAGGA